MAQGTYDENLSDTKDWVRLLIGDRGPTTFFLSDTEIEAFVAGSENKYLAAADALEALLMVWVAGGTGLKSKNVEGLSVSFAGPEDMKKRISTLRAMGATELHPRPKVFRVLV